MDYNGHTRIDVRWRGDRWQTSPKMPLNMRRPADPPYRQVPTPAVMRRSRRSGLAIPRDGHGVAQQGRVWSHQGWAIAALILPFGELPHARYYRPPVFGLL